jgi:hypothetical protein
MFGDGNLHAKDKAHTEETPQQQQACDAAYDPLAHLLTPNRSSRNSLPLHSSFSPPFGMD